MSSRPGSEPKAICGRQRADGSICTNAAGCKVPHPAATADASPAGSATAGAAARADGGYGPGDDAWTIAAPVVHEGGPESWLSPRQVRSCYDDATYQLLADALARPGSPAERVLQSESPGGLAHSAIAAIRRGEEPAERAANSLAATLAWRSVRSDWWESYGPVHSLRARLDGASRRHDEAAERRARADRFVNICGGDRGDLDLETASLRLRGAFAQHMRLAGDPEADWEGVLGSILHDALSHPNAQAYPDGRVVADIDAEVRNDPTALRARHTEAIIALHVRSDPWRSPGMMRAVRRWATAHAESPRRRERDAAKELRAAERDLADADFIELVGTGNAETFVAAADKATAAGVRMNPNTLNMIDEARQHLWRRIE